MFRGILKPAPERHITTERDNFELRSKINDVVSKFNEINKENEQLGDERSRLEQLWQHALQEIARLRDENSELERKYKESESENQILKDQFLLLTHQLTFKKLQNEISKLNATLRMCQDRNRTTDVQVDHLKEQLENKINLMDQWKNKCYQIIDKITNAANSLLEEGVNLPQIVGNNTNNADEREVQAFVNKVKDEAGKWRGILLNELANTQTSTLKRQDCMGCKKPFKMARCLVKTCGSVFHEECVHQQFGRNVQCPKCKNDSITVEG
ncbi:hypothetical protein CAEBREN_08708 [Caenorhabditis brenneri]|uniref:RING-type domain-containing protein n=1 Tax=Caenorhabditis brenneri TaxID=135651 RepID=G0MYB7_CAEBE|nr:hypothetical protein CAEBREN_08708 [Caenorhabditis brenneri]